MTSKWCPQCRDEFVRAMERCPECEVDLVSELGDAELPGSGIAKGVQSWVGDLDKQAAEAQRQRSEWQEAEACPACQTPMRAEAAECAECGLVFVEDAEQ